MNNVEVAKHNNENTSSLIRRFTKRVQGSGVLPKARSLRYFDRATSKATNKKSALKSIERRDKYEELAKLGRAPVKTRRR